MIGGRRFIFFHMENLIFPAPFLKRPFLVRHLCHKLSDYAHTAGLSRRVSPWCCIQGCHQWGEPPAPLFSSNAHWPWHFTFHVNFRLCLSRPKRNDDRRKQCWGSDWNYMNLETIWEKSNTFPTPSASEFVSTILTHYWWAGHVVLSLECWRLSTGLPCDPAIPFLGVHPTRHVHVCAEGRV